MGFASPADVIRVSEIFNDNNLTIEILKKYQTDLIEMIEMNLIQRENPKQYKPMSSITGFFEFYLKKLYAETENSNKRRKL
jgi:hypothetical protein